MKWWPFGKRVPKKASVRMYESARQSRLTSDWSSANSSEDYELSTSLRMLRQRSRSLVRDNPYGKRVRTIVVNNVVGSGIGLQAAVVSTRGRLNNRVNDEIESVWREWCQPSSCHTGGVLHFADLERMAMAQVVEAGEIFIRKHYDGTGRVPLSLEVIEPERLAEDYEAPEAAGITTKLGIEVDRMGRPLAYWVRELHPGEIRRNIGATDRLIRVPAEQIIHLRIVDRWPQTRGVPWFHAAAKRLRDMDGYTEAEIVAARMSAAYMGFIKSSAVPEEDDTQDNRKILEFDAGLIQHLGPGEEFQGFAPGRPNAQLDPFMRYMLREVAAAVGVSYESLSRDYSQSNYSSSRLALLDDRDLWKALQQWFIRSFREPLHREWLSLAVMSGAIASVPAEQYLTNRAKFEAVQFKPRGWGWVDPTKEVAAYKEAVLAGFTTVGDVIAATGNGADLEDTLNARRRELDLMEELDLEFDTEYESPDDMKEDAAEPEPEAPDEPQPDEEDAMDRWLAALKELRMEAAEDRRETRALISDSIAEVRRQLQDSVAALTRDLATKEQAPVAQELTAALAVLRDVRSQVDDMAASDAVSGKWISAIAARLDEIERQQAALSERIAFVERAAKPKPKAAKKEEADEAAGAAA
jgi:lambda family phage portal protein